jgi:hypothetical protein
MVDVELDKENHVYAFQTLNNVKEIIKSLNEDGLDLEFEILECRCLQKTENVNEAKQKYEKLSLRYPQDPRSLLYLSEIYLLNHEYNKNKELIDKAEKIDSNNWLLKAEKLLSKINYKQDKIVEDINEYGLPDDNRIKSIFYRIISNLYYESEDISKARSSIEKAINLNPNSYKSCLFKLTLVEAQLYKGNEEPAHENIQELINEIQTFEDKFITNNNVGPRNSAIFNLKKMNVYYVEKKYELFIGVFKETFNLLLTCYFDHQIDDIFCMILFRVQCLDDDFNKLLTYLSQSQNGISDSLASVLVYQFNSRNDLLKNGLKFFKAINKSNFALFIEDILNNKNSNVFKFLIKDINFAVMFVISLKELPDLRQYIIDNLPNDKNIQKDKLLLLLNYDKKNYDQAINHLKKLDLSKLNHHECRLVLDIARHKNAWDFQQIILRKLLEKESNENVCWNLKLELFYATSKLKQYLEIIKNGKEIIDIDLKSNRLIPKDKESILGSILSAHLNRGEYKEAKALLEKYPLPQSSLEFKVAVEAEVYLKNNEPKKAIESIVDGVKRKGILHPEEYAKLYFLFIQIGNLTNFKYDSLQSVEENTFVKLTNQDIWYYIGNGIELDASKITSDSEMYSVLIKKGVGEKVIIKNRYSSEQIENIIEIILPVEKYILWKSVYHFHKLTVEKRWDNARTVEIKNVNGEIDLKYLISFFEDINQKNKPFFDMYCKNNVPLAMLAVNEGGILRAIGQIQQQNKGFVNFSDGTPEEAKRQKELSNKILLNKLPFYVDGTSALVLAESGYLEKIYCHIPNVKVPQSVINLLISTKNRFAYSPGNQGSMGYAHGKIIISSVDESTRKNIRENFKKSTGLLESNPQNIMVVSSANKEKCFSEQKVPDELCDACILAQRDKMPVLTEDFIYLFMNKLETKKEAPEYFSSLYLIRMLYEQHKVTFLEYIDYFGYLSSYRFRFLSLNSEDIEKTVLGDELIKIVKPENICKLNLPLTLSEEYGVSFESALGVMGGFLIKVLADDSISTSIAEKIFIEIMTALPTKMNKRFVGQILLGGCDKAFKNSQSKLIVKPKNQNYTDKMKKLMIATEIWNIGDQLWTPNEF